MNFFFIVRLFNLYEMSTTNDPKLFDGSHFLGSWLCAINRRSSTVTMDIIKWFVVKVLLFHSSIHRASSRSRLASIYVCTHLKDSCPKRSISLSLSFDEMLRFPRFWSIADVRSMHRRRCWKSQSFNDLVAISTRRHICMDPVGEDRHFFPFLGS
jgi:hypothetical protein